MTIPAPTASIYAPEPDNVITVFVVPVPADVKSNYPAALCVTVDSSLIPTHQARTLSPVAAPALYRRNSVCV